jgi:YbbR domain-containing protein
MTEPAGLGVKTLSMAVSLLLALMLWAYVKSTKPLNVHYLKVPVQGFNAENMPKNLIVGRLGTAWIEVSGPEDEFDTAIDDITNKGLAAVYVDLSTAHVGTDVYPLRLTLARRDRPYKVALSDRTMSVKIEQRDQVTFPVTIEESGQISPDRNLAFNGATAKPSMVTASGAIDAVRFVKKVRALVDLSPVDSSAVLPVRLEALDERDQPVQGVTLDPDTISIAVGVAPASLTKTVLVEPVITGQQAVGYMVTEFTVEPNQVAVQGPPSLLARTSKVQTRPIAINDLRTSTSFEVPLSMEAGLKSYSVQTVKVRVNIAPKANVGGAPQTVGP